MPSWLQGFASHQPITPVIETIRALLAGAPVGDHGWKALLWCGGILLAAIVWGAIAFARKSKE
jgi:ABC-2 type transport system permease protein